MTRFTLFALVGIGALMAGCTQGGGKVAGIHNEPGRMAALQDLDMTTTGPLSDFENGVELTEQDKKSLEKALPTIKDLVKYDPTNFANLILLGKTQLALEHTDDAEAAYKAAVKYTPGMLPPDTLMMLGSVHNDMAKISLAKNDFAEADAQVDLALQVAPNEPRFLWTQASVLTQEKHYDKALVILDKALKVAPENTACQGLKKFILTATKSKGAPS